MPDDNKEKFLPLYDKKCTVCGQSPVVAIVDEHGNVDSVDLCGPCTFGEAACVNPEEW